MDKQEELQVADIAPAEIPDYEDEIKAIVRGNDSPEIIQDKLEDYHGNDIAQVMEDLSPEERAHFFSTLSASLLAEAFEYLDEDEASAYLKEMGLTKAVAVVSEMETDQATDVLREMDQDDRSKIIDAVSPDTQEDIRLVASFDEDEIGSKMTTNFILLQKGITVPAAMRELVRQAEKNDNISTLFVVDDKERLYGAVDLKKLITARAYEPFDDLVVTSFPFVYATEQIDDCIERIKDYSEDSIPVLDNNNQFLGVVTAQNVIELVDDEMGEDYAKLGGLTAEEDLAEPLFESMKKRLPWLFALLGLGIVVSTVVGAFERVVAQLTLVMAFQSLILDMAGNVGTQSLAVTIRVLMDENLGLAEKVRLVSKETRVGLFNGLILGAISTVFVGLYIMLVKQRPAAFAFSVSGCVGIAMLVAMVISSTVGTLIPLFFKRINVDPAVASGPLITTINDLVAVVTYYGMSWLLLINLLHLV